MEYSKCKFYTTDNKVIAVSSFAGKTVRGIAKCNPNDSFDEEIGKKLAAMRCEIKVAEKRLKRARKKHDEATVEVAQAQKFLQNMTEYEVSAEQALNQLQFEYEVLMDSYRSH